jgi:hypothetical protein
LHVGAQSSGSADDPLKEWTAACHRVLGGAALDVNPFRHLPDYYGFQNCADDGFRNAARTLQARITQYGRSNSEVREWARAQVAVFRNCSEETLVVPEPTGPAADSGIRADRAYQTAAAYFYAMQYDEAARRFQAIASDRSSPWRPYGRYLAARARIRRATLAADDQEAMRLFTSAEADLNATLDDPDAVAMHRAAQALLKHHG